MVARTQHTSAGTRTEIAIVGGGLAGGLIALALRRLRPEISAVLIEQGKMLGGNHRWSWFDSDLAEPGSTALMAGFRTADWHGYGVRFPAYQRQLGSQYRSLASLDFDARLRRELSQESIYTGCGVAALDGQSVTLDSGARISARVVIDCRGAVPSAHLRGGWQVFMGRHIRTRRPHGVARPTIMDAAVRQHGAFRFVYTLPLGANDLFIEDTYYADEPVLDRSALSARIDAYTQAQGWGAADSDDFEIIGHEGGVLPVITGGSFADYQAAQRTNGVVVAGARGGFVHPLTSYTLPFAVETALAIAARADLSGPQLAGLMEARARRHWARTRYYRMLGSMLFGAAEPELRYRIFEHFYRLNEDLVERFYAARSTFPDKARILFGKPPVAVSKAIQALVTPGHPLADPQETRT